MNCSISVQRALLARGRETSCRIFLQPAVQGQRVHLGPFLDGLLRLAPQIIPSMMEELPARDGHAVIVLRNARGRPPETFKLSNPHYRIEDREEKEEELFHADGVLYEPPTRMAEFPPKLEELLQIPAAMHIATKFYSFENRGQILHKIERRASHILHEHLPGLRVEELARLVPFRLDHFRLGFEAYKPSDFGAMFGLVPNIQHRFYLEAAPSRIFMYLQQIGLRDKRQVPLEQSGIVGTLDTVLSEQGIFPDFLSRLQSRIQRR